MSVFGGRGGGGSHQETAWFPLNVANMRTAPAMASKALFLCSVTRLRPDVPTALCVQLLVKHWSIIPDLLLPKTLT